MPNKDNNSIVFLAAHSGNGKIAFFKDLNQLKVGDKISLKYKDTLYLYQVNHIWEENKSGYVHINQRTEKELILTTCSPENEKKQLIISSSLTSENTSFH